MVLPMLALQLEAGGSQTSSEATAGEIAVHPAPLLRMAPSGTTTLCYHPAGENGHSTAYYRLFLTALRGYADGPKPIWKYALSPCLKEGYVETEAFSSVPQLEACLWYPILKIGS